MKRLFTLGLLGVLAGCATIQDSNRISSDLSASEFNSISSQYMPKPTFVSLETFSSGEKALAINMKTYAMNKYGMDNSEIRYNREFVDDYIGFIDKYLSWEKLAVDRQDAFTKEIGEAKSWYPGMDGDLKFTFYSGNSNNHYLTVTFCTMIICLDNAHYYDRKNAERLKQLLEQLKNGQFVTTNIKDVYQ
ncbi:hypothetical protein [Vibrio furnissii]|uniref:hypothetical protein n=1 Tax=Vibrio furnissii TaxID=29494 RepID=UPI001EEA1D05|nr:hypothetical protein [Vibrio furnissii]MCG6233089.1 hypothetical protein [Vibrio furnissii]MCG6258957.1 hypothetical protein [Vibrio furnissii]